MAASTLIQTMVIAAKNLNYTSAYTAQVWENYQFSVTLGQSFIVLMQVEARWLISSNLTNEAISPNLAKSAYVDGLKPVKPDAVNIIGQ